MDTIEDIGTRVEAIKTFVDDMIAARKEANKIEDMRERAIAYHETVSPYFKKIRANIDRLELVVDDKMWTLPKYRELLFIR